MIIRGWFAFAMIAVATAAPERPEMIADFAWFSSLGLPDANGLKFVHYTYGWSGGRAETAKPMWNYGWLVDENENDFSVRTVDFGIEKLNRKGRAEKHAWDDHSFEPADFQQYLEEELKPRYLTEHTVGQPEREPKTVLSTADVHHGVRGRPHLGRLGQLFTLSWICSRQGADEIADRLYGAAQNLPGAKLPFHQKLEAEIGKFEIWRITVDFGDLSITRRQLFSRLEPFAQQFPASPEVTRATEMADELKKMIAEDDAHPVLTKEQIGALPTAEQAKEWIFQLRDEYAVQTDESGSVHFLRPSNHRDSPAHQLQVLGEAAVPALTAALDDQRLTRSVHYGRDWDFVFSYEVLRVGDAAHQILREIHGVN